MKKYLKIHLLLAFAALAIVQGCNDILEEHPKTAFTSDYYKTSQGLQDGINAAYASLRFQYGTNPALGLNETGTDEYTFGPEPNYNSSGDNLPHKQMGQYTHTAAQGFLGVTYDRTFPVINMLNMLIDFAPNVSGLSAVQRATILGEAHYLRAHYYYFLVSQFGASPVDLGGGDYKFNSTVFLGFNRLDPNLLAKNYQGMIDDLIYASENLPDKRPAAQFKLSKAVALHLLSKIYLFRAYSSVAQAGDFQASYDAARQLIDNQGLYGVALQQNFVDVFRQGNDYNSELLLAAERVPRDNQTNEYTNPSGIGDRENMSNNVFTCNYEQPTLRSGADPIDGRPFRFQRPLRKLAPTQWLVNTAFADKTNDARYHGSFRTLYTIESVNAVGTAAYNTFVAAMTTAGRAIGDTAFYIADTQAQANSLNAKNRWYRVYGPDDWYTNQRYPTSTGAVLVYPSLSKFDDIQRANFNDATGRPMPIFRLAETYLNAAEAAMQIGNTTEAANLINVVRQRAAYRSSRPGRTPAQNASDNTAAAAAMVITPATVTLDFILDERARELAGESLRWTDLAARGETTFVNRVKLNPDAQAVQGFHRLRPIPQSQLDRVNDAEKTKYQNPGF